MLMVANPVLTTDCNRYFTERKYQILENTTKFFYNFSEFLHNLEIPYYLFSNHEKCIEIGRKKLNV